MHPTICQCCGQASRESEPANPNVCLGCYGAVGESGGGDEGAGHVLQFKADDCLVLAHAEGAQVKAA